MAAPLDENGVPVYSREDIDEKAEQVLHYFVPECLNAPRFTPLAEIATGIHREFKVLFDFDQDLGSTTAGNRILGKFVTSPRAVLVDCSLEVGSPRWSFTLAHELGHFVLHRNVRVELGVEQYSTFADTLAQLRAALEKPRTAFEWLEWQANSFASSLLMPRETFSAMAIDLLRKNAGARGKLHVYLDKQAHNVQLLHEIKDPLAKLFNVSSTAAEIRMRELNFLIDTRQRDSTHISQFLREDS